MACLSATNGCLCLYSYSICSDRGHRTCRIVSCGPAALGIAGPRTRTNVALWRETTSPLPYSKLQPSIIDRAGSTSAGGFRPLPYSSARIPFIRRPRGERARENRWVADGRQHGYATSSPRPASPGTGIPRCTAFFISFTSSSDGHYLEFFSPPTRHPDADVLGPCAGAAGSVCLPHAPRTQPIRLSSAAWPRVHAGGTLPDG